MTDGSGRLARVVGRRRLVVWGAGGVAAVAAGAGLWRLLDDDGASEQRWDQVWSRSLGSAYFTTLDVHDQVVYLSGSGEVLALDAARGKQLWRAPGDLDSQSRLVFGDGVVCLHGVRTGGRTVVHTVDTASGRVRWEREIEGLATHDPVVAGDIVLLLTDTGSVAGPAVVHGLARDDGRTVWRRELSSRITGAGPMVAGKDLVHIMGRHFEEGPRGWALDATTGAVRWEFNPDGSTMGDPLLAEGTLYAVVRPANVLPEDAHDTLYALAPDSGSVLRRVGGLPVGSLRLLGAADDTVYAALTPPGDQPRGSLLAIGTGSGKIRWKSGTDLAEADAFLVTGDTVIVGGTQPARDTSTGPYLTRAFDAGSGKRRWNHDWGNQASSAGPALSGGTLCLPVRGRPDKPDEHTRLTFLDASTGRQRWRHTLPAGGEGTARADGRTVYALALPHPPAPGTNRLPKDRDTVVCALRRPT